MADEEGVLAEGDQVVAEYGESDGACGKCTRLRTRCLLGSHTCACTVCSSEDGAESLPEEPEIADEAVQVFRGHTGACACRLQQLCAAKRGCEQLSPADAVFAVAWSPAQEGLVATGGGDDRAFLWQVGRPFRDQQAL